MSPSTRTSPYICGEFWYNKCVKKLAHLFVLGLLAFGLTLILIDTGGYARVASEVYKVQDEVANSLTAAALATPRETGPFIINTQ